MMTKEATIPQTKHADGMTLPSCSQKYFLIRVRGSQENRSLKMFPYKFLTSTAYQPKQLLSYMM